MPFRIINVLFPPILLAIFIAVVGYSILIFVAVGRIGDHSQGVIYDTEEARIDDRRPL